MRIAIVCNDTQGGVQPYVALGSGLAAAGHDVRLVAPSIFAKLASAAGLPFAALSFADEQQHADATALAEKGTFAAMRAMMTQMPQHMATSARATLAGCEGAEIVTGGIGGMITGIPAAARLGVPFIETHLQPIGIRGDFQSVLFSGMARFGKFGNVVGQGLTDLALKAQFGPGMTMARKAIGAPSKQHNFDSWPTIYGFSRHVVPVPTTPGRHVVGYWSLPPAKDWSPPADVTEFLARPGPIVSIGFGSMGSVDPVALRDLVRSAAELAGVRAIVLSGWARITGAADDRVIFASQLPHDWLFPQMSAVVHHGGAGTSGAGFKSGVPSILIPFGVDQPFWASRVVALGVGPEPLLRKKLTAKDLAARIAESLADQTMRARAKALGEKIRNEDGVGNAVRIFGEIASRVGNGQPTARQLR